MGFVVVAQPTITKMHNLSLGDKYSAKTVDELVDVSLITQGANQVWDFSNLQSSSAATSAECIDPAITPFVDSVQVQNCNIALKTEGIIGTDTITYQFLKVENNKYEMLALGITGATTNLSYSKWLDPMEVLHLPFTYGDSFNDQYIMWMNYIVQNAVILKDTTNIQVEGVGYGTLKTPAGTFKDALLVKKTSQWKWWNNYDNYVYKTEGIDIDYQWFVPGVKIPVLNIMFMAEDQEGVAIYISETDMTEGGLSDAENGNGNENEDDLNPYNPNGIWLNVTSSGSGFFSKSIGSVDWTLGEAVIETCIESPEILTQGFCQPMETITSVKEQVVEFEAKIYPNPFTDEITINLPVYNQSCNGAIYSSTGQIIRNFTIDSSETTIHLNDCNSGLYYIRIIVENQPFSYVVIKQ